MSWLAIDFGTSESSAAFMNNNGDLKKVKFTSPNSATLYDFPTTAWVNENGDILVGYEANANASRDPAKYIFEFKLDLDDSRDNIKGGVSYTDVITAILKKIKQEAEMERNGNVIFANVVITVPVDFRKNATDKIKNGAIDAGFSKVEIITEPQAAAIYFNRVAAKSQENHEFTALIYDMGCGTFDPAIIHIKNSDIGIDYSLPINGAGTQKAGKYFDRLIQSRFEEIHPIPAENRALINRELKKKCKDEIKCILSGQETASFDIMYSTEGMKTFSLDRSTFNEMIEPAVEESIQKCQALIDNNNHTWQNIDVIFFVGGSCNVPYVRKCVETYARRYNNRIQTVWNQFRGTDLEPQYAVCLGAALYINHLKETTMNAKIYTDKRDTLLRIINKILKIDKLGEEKRAEFESINKKCLENQFNIVLVGEFQGGKSTTFNTFCDGREISPRGAMVKTSACKITARNLSDQSQSEYAEVLWKTERELILNIEDILSKHISLEDLGISYQPGDERKPLSELLSFSNQNHYQKMSNAVSQEWDNYEKHRSSYSPESLDILRIATIILRYVNTEDATMLREKSTVSINDISDIVVFPKDWEGRWSVGINARFSFAEIKFTFVANVDCYIHSPNLSRLGCTITDCPGLFASKWDTQVALDTIPKADAILYLLNGTKAIGTGDAASLREIQRMPAAHKKMFFAINLKNPRHIIDNSIIPVDVATINNIGFRIVERNIQRYHALLAFLAEFGQKYVDNKLDENSKKIFVSMTKQLFGCEMSIEQSWVMQTNQHLMLTCVPPQMVSMITQDSVDTVRLASGFNELFDSIENFVVRNKAESILITNGAEKCFSALTNIENTLRNREDEASGDVEMKEVELQLAKEKLLDFQTQARKTVNGSFQQAVFGELATNYFDEIIRASSDTIARSASPLIALKLTKEFAFRYKVASKFNQERMIRELLDPILREILKEVISQQFSVWITSVQKGENEVYKSGVIRKVNELNLEIKSYWEKVEELNFKAVELEFPSPYMVIDFEKISPDIPSDAFNVILNNLIRELTWNIIGYMLVSPLILAGMAVAFLGAIFSWIVDLISDSDSNSDGNSTVEEEVSFEYDETNKKHREIYRILCTQLNAMMGDVTFYKNTRTLIVEQLTKSIGGKLKLMYNEKLDIQEKEFIKEYEMRKANLKKSTDERRAVATAANKLRTEQIEPCNKEIKIFMESTKKIILENGSR